MLFFFLQYGDIQWQLLWQQQLKESVKISLDALISHHLESPESVEPCLNMEL